MKFEQRFRGPNTPPLGAMVGGLMFFGATVATAWLRLGLPLPGCNLRDLTGLPCITCGSTRMFEALLAGNVFEAVACNPLVFSAMTALAIWSVWSATRSALGLPAWRVVLVRRERLGLAIIATTALLCGWSYLLSRGI